MAETPDFNRVIKERVRVVMAHMGPRTEAMHSVLEECDRQDEQWGEQDHHPAYWLAILGKQVGQFGSAVLNREWWTDKDAATAALRHEAVQTAAVALQVVECIDRGKMPVGLTTMPQGRQRAHALGHGDEQMDYSADEPDPNDDTQREHI